MSIFTYLRPGEKQRLLQYFYLDYNILVELDHLSQKYLFSHPKHGLIYQCDTLEDKDKIYEDVRRVMELLLLFGEP
jgi:hypothetical protein